MHDDWWSGMVNININKRCSDSGFLESWGTDDRGRVCYPCPRHEIRSRRSDVQVWSFTRKCLSQQNHSTLSCHTTWSESFIFPIPIHVSDVYFGVPFWDQLSVTKQPDNPLEDMAAEVPKPNRPIRSRHKLNIWTILPVDRVSLP